MEAGERAVRGVLIERNLRLVVYIARKFENTGIAVEDLVSIGTIGLIKAVNTFDPAKKIKLATYASRCIENEILMYLRRNSKTKAEVSFDEPLNTDWDGNELLLSDVFGDGKRRHQAHRGGGGPSAPHGRARTTVRPGKAHHGAAIRPDRRTRRRRKKRWRT